MPRHQRILSENGTYHVMIRGNERKNLFLDEEDKQRFIEILNTKKEEMVLLFTFIVSWIIMSTCWSENLQKGWQR